MSNKLMLGLWRYILHVPPFIWQKQIEKGKKRFEKEYGKMPNDFRNVHHFVVKELPEMMKPLTESMISENLELSIDQVRSALDYLEKRMTYLFRNKEGEVVWAYPVTVEKTPHKLTFDTGEKIYAAWAADAIATPFVQGKLRNENVVVRVQTECAHCGKTMEMDIDSNLQFKLNDEKCKPIVFVMRSTNRSYTWSKEIFNNETDKLVVDAELTCVFINSASGEIFPINEKMKSIWPELAEKKVE